MNEPLTPQKAQTLLQMISQLAESEAQKISTSGKDESEAKLRRNIQSGVQDHLPQLLTSYLVADRYRRLVVGFRCLVEDAGILSELKATFAGFLAGAKCPDTTGVSETENGGK